MNRSERVNMVKAQAKARSKRWIVELVASVVLLIAGAVGGQDFLADDDVDCDQVEVDD